MLTLISKIKKQLLWIWVGFSVPVILLIFVQTIAGKYAEIEWVPWLWAGISLLPGFLLLMIGAIQNRFAGKLVQTFIYRIILISVVAYLVLVLMTLFSMTAGAAEQSLEAYFRQSYKWLVPFQLVLMAVFVLMYFREEAIFRPNEKIIKGYIEERAQKAAGKNNLPRQQAFEQLVSGNYDQLFENLQKLFGGKPEFEDVILLNSKYSKWKKDNDLGVIDPKNAQLAFNKITQALINLIENI